ncbi:MAG TPA: hypothetical protein PKM16_11220, partial [Bacteroidia bacterium]|nr:hypothetical protein [Bacteroidia bacterium]
MTTHTKYNRIVSCLSLVTFLIFLSVAQLSAQVLQMSDFVLFTGPGGQGTTNPLSPGPGVHMKYNNTIQGGMIGSHVLIKTTGSVLINADMHSLNKMFLKNGNQINGDLSITNQALLNGQIFTAGTNTQITGNINVNGNSEIKGGFINGMLTRPANRSYNGPIPSGGIVVGNPTLPVIPNLPAITNFPPASNNHILNSQTISPGAYGNIFLSGNQTLKLSGPGVYVFNEVNNTGLKNS